jgi:hypothetical protein
MPACHLNNRALEFQRERGALLWRSESQLCDGPIIFIKTYFLVALYKSSTARGSGLPTSRMPYPLTVFT